ncbi:hypothetical protein EPD60_14000 [Flaviaesturariibacter flavus]|uniref:Uncharacterized protein n=1 Tax=Flaviaesturariibacter flavus TaxID=2502780 RepID=A0A4R1B8J7_9BACT|nr:hypothetical protein [Flaviaesturariibacter flavus]TCJ13015.1 hypothetical protein EPD60_14000 [Flaviaesturariibacter flavus]
MTERALLNYFLGKSSAEDLSNDTIGSQQRTSRDVTAVTVSRIADPGSFSVTRNHLIALCKDSLAGKLSFGSLNTIAFAINMSEYFTYDESDEVVGQVLFEWDNPEIDGPLTIESIEHCLFLLESSRDTLESQDRRDGA